ncbi:hypothetical protein SS50377_20576 [Spironucleus salmonicida]|uniref:Uncharacterized protein n=1 Tax=Spironucleus salmonicida TaxID=348837 RepID=V6LWU3_9EUKA|nr:hypothetical protein SS50377_20576 [Spironucleus salmonicida]|eukprot:EST48166.1 Hypothetical protein SS50377_11684 [Spironucleus salmonicida]
MNQPFLNLLKNSSFDNIEDDLNILQTPLQNYHNITSNDTEDEFIFSRLRPKDLQIESPPQKHQKLLTIEDLVFQRFQTLMSQDLNNLASRYQ